MPILYDIIKNEKIVMCVGSGTVTAEEIIDHLKMLAEDIDYIPPMKKLVDYRTIEDILISPEEALIIAQTKKGLSVDFLGEKCAFVAPNDRTFNASQTHQFYVDADGINNKAFKTFDEAMKWLDISISNNQ